MSQIQNIKYLQEDSQGPACKQSTSCDIFAQNILWIILDTEQSDKKKCLVAGQFTSM